MDPYRIPVIAVEDPLLPSTFRGTSSDERGYQRIRVRQDTRDNWLKNDPILASGEFAFVIGSTNLGETLKIGDGTLRWSQLPWLMATGNSGPPGPSGPAGPGPTVYEQDTAPLGASLKDGDIWLQPFATRDASEPATLEDVHREMANIIEQLKAGMVIEAGGVTMVDVEATVARSLSEGEFVSVPWVESREFATVPYVEDRVAHLARPAPTETAGGVEDSSPPTDAEVVSRLTALENVFNPATPAGAAYERHLKTIMQSVLVGGGKTPPPDIPWTPCTLIGGGAVRARMVNGFVQLEGVSTFSTANSGVNFLTLPAGFPPPELEACYAAAMREVGVVVRAGYVCIQTNNKLSVSPNGKVNEITLTGIQWKAKY
jgi:hypothetical protein